MSGSAGFGGMRPPPARAKRQYRPGQAPQLDESDSDSNDAVERRSIVTLGTLNTMNTGATAGMSSDLRSMIIKEGHRGVLTSTPAASKPPKVKDTPQGAIKAETISPVKEKKLDVGEVIVVERRRRIVPNLTRKEEDNTNIQSETEEHLGKRKPINEIEAEPVQKDDKAVSEEEQDDEEESDDNVFPSGQRAKLTRPVFITETLRRNIMLTEAEDARLKHDKQLLQDSIKNRNQSLAIESKKERADIEEEDISEFEPDLPNDSTDEEDIAYEKWKIRELARLKRDREERDKLFREKEAIERRRLMTDEERAKDDKRIGKYKEEQKSHYRFMQKHYSKGIYHIDDDDPLFKRDYNIAVGEDLFDKSTLPVSKQVRRGEEHKKGKSKYTHLVAEDTTNFDPEWLPAEDIHNKHKGLTAGYKNASLFERPSSKR